VSIAAAKDVPDGQGEDTQIEPQRRVVDLVRIVLYSLDQVAAASGACRKAHRRSGRSLVAPFALERTGAVDPSPLCGIIAPLDALFFEGRAL
jgi:hypothetical protein